jgi:hypothetical protein
MIRLAIDRIYSSMAAVKLNNTDAPRKLSARRRCRAEIVRPTRTR